MQKNARSKLKSMDLTSIKMLSTIENRMSEMDYYRERLKIAGALIAAELDRINWIRW